MDYQQLIETMSLETYHALLRSVELGKWPDGKVLSTEQRENAMQAIIAWGERHLALHDRVGFIDKKQKSGEECDTLLETPLNWKE